MLPAHHLATVLFLVLAHLVQIATCQIKGVNLGGWLLSEPWITPSLYDNVSAEDEWHLCDELGKDSCSQLLRTHWKSFLNQSDFQAIQSAGLNAVRIPIGYWAVDLEDWEPYVDGQFDYLARAVRWADEAGLDVIVSLHGLPGSQNGQENSGLAGEILFASNSSNFERSLRVLTNLSAEFSQDVYGGAVKSIELANEPRIGSSLPFDDLLEYYQRGSDAVRAEDPSSSINITIHDAFQPLTSWEAHTSTANITRLPTTSLTLDTHQYYAFYPHGNLSESAILDSVCAVSKQLKEKSSKSKLPPVLVGEWSLAQNSSMLPENYASNGTEYTSWLRLFFEAQHAAYSPNGPHQASTGWIFWTWRTENDVAMWSYRQGLAEGYIPANVSDSSLLKYKVDKHGCVKSLAGRAASVSKVLVVVGFVAAVFTYS
ncbi:glycoside hydrolase family 5 protein [Zasmidium cellare ATCC 36951]|uniref:Glycoside hydrolase family 5 protein n=1 Tax=Zasmidium cellare ATCC 36951 TaxID=1080233 RepID=A0A6A6CHM4_ZASCE|nr:glycoside hydrolase family 5 protein [Zasmidium cellare ATCC 36951]KAF2166635.1 glycoside hydrolase family 5 protein [Zasmidium cellare ATCC 36951]